MARSEGAKRLELIHPDIIPADVQPVPVEDIRERIADLNQVDLTSDQPLPSTAFMQHRGSGKIDLSAGLKRALKKDPSRLDAFYASIIERAINGDHNATKLIFDRVEGAVPQRIGVGQLTTEQIAQMLELDASREDEEG